MSTDGNDLVADVLAAIERREATATAALGTYWPRDGDEALPGDGEWTFRGDYDGPRVSVEQTGADVAACLMDDYEHTRMSAEHGEHIAENDPRSILRLCRAHRQIVDERQKAAMHLNWAMANEGRGEYDARRELARWDQVLRILAVGLGVVEEDQ